MQTSGVQRAPIFNINNISVGLSWDVLKKDAVDLDASCFIFDCMGNVLDIVYYNQLSSRDGSVVHSGDEKSGQREGVDEMITLYPLLAHPSLQYFIFVITVHSAGHTFSQVKTASCCAWDGAGFPISTYSVGLGGNQKAMVMAMVCRIDGVWYFESVGEVISHPFPSSFREFFSHPPS